MIYLRRAAMLAAITTTATLSLWVRADAAAPYSIADLGPLSGDNSSAILGLNNKGQAAGYSLIEGQPTSRKAAIWITTTPGNISSVPDSGLQANDYDRALGINDAGQVVGVTEQTTGSYHNHAFVWTLQGGLQDIGTLTNGFDSVATGINAAGTLVGYSNLPAFGGLPDHAFIWTPAGGFTDLGTFGGAASRAFAINASGQVVGWANDASNNQTAFIWNNFYGLQSLGTEPGDTSSSAAAINASGVVAGSSGTTDSSHGFKWDLAHGMQDLGTLGGTHTYATGINNAGQIVGSSETGTGETHAFVWTASKGMQDLNSQVAPGTGWVLTQANAINASGQIAGVGTINGATHGFLLTIPLPLDLSLSPSTLTFAQVGTGTVTLGSPATSGPNPYNGGAVEPGIFVRLSANSSTLAISGNALIAPDGNTYVRIPQGETQATFSLEAGPIAHNMPVVVTASIPGASRTAVLTITLPQIQSFTLSPAMIYNGGNSTATITLASPAFLTLNPFDGSLFYGALIKLTSSKAAAVYGNETFVGPDGATYVVMPYGQSQVTVTVFTNFVTTETDAKLVATLGSAKPATLKITPTLVQSLSLSPTTRYNGTLSTATVTLNGPALYSINPANGQQIAGVLVKLTSDNPAAAIDTSDGHAVILPDGNTYVYIPSGVPFATFTVRTTAVPSATSAHISASLNGKSKSAPLLVTPTLVQSITLNQSSLYNNTRSTGTVTLNGVSFASINPVSGVPISGVLVKLTPDNTSAFIATDDGHAITLPDGNTYVYIPQGQTTAVFGFITRPVTANTKVKITAELNGSSKAATLTVTPPAVKSLTIAPPNVYNGGTATATLSLDNPANYGYNPTNGQIINGALVKLDSSIAAAIIRSNDGVVYTLPDGNTYAYFQLGQTTLTFVINTSMVNANTTATITASLNGSSRAATLVVKPTQVQYLTLDPSTTDAGSSSTATIILNSPALTSINPATGTQISGALVKVALSSSTATFGSGVITQADGNTYVYMPAGQTTATFSIDATAVIGHTSVAVSATLNGVTKNAALTILP